MKNYDIRRLGRDMDAWLQARFMSPILNIEGGWEYWIQIDFPCWLDAMADEPFDIRREYVESGVRLDWMMNATSQMNMVAVNIKAQTHKYQTDRLLKDVRADVVKLEGIADRSIARKMIVAVVDRTAEADLHGDGFKTIYDAQDRSFAIMSLDVKPGK